jgi:hypothetical protein
MGMDLVGDDKARIVAIARIALAGISQARDE